MFSTNKAKHTVLIVDDSEDFRFIVSEHLLGVGYKTAQACNGREALSYLAAHKMIEGPSAIVLDVSMPVMTGSEFLNEKRKNNAICDIPVVLFSSNMSLGEIAKQDASVVVAISKITKANALILAVHIAVSKSELQQLLKTS